MGEERLPKQFITRYPIGMVSKGTSKTTWMYRMCGMVEETGLTEEDMGDE